MEFSEFQHFFDPEFSGFPENLPSLSLYHRDATSEIEGAIYEPVLCLILQGSKVTSIGEHTVPLRPGEALVVGHDLPVLSRITEAPYRALILRLDLGVVRGLYEQVADLPMPDTPPTPLTAGPAHPSWLDPLARYCASAENPMDAAVLGPALLREIHYRLLLSPQGRALRPHLRADSHASRVSRALHRLRSEFRTPISIPDLAGTAGMSASSFHQHFKSVTGTTPLQYQKDLRLIEARSLLRSVTRSVSDAAYAVGYESATQFSRDYSRKFGTPPSRDKPSLT